MIRALALSAFLLVSWQEDGLDCHGAPLRSPIDHYEVRVFRAELVDWTVDPQTGDLSPVYWRSLATETLATETSLTIELGVGDVVGWDGMWDATWQIQPPIVEAFTVAGAGSDEPCP
jgi:hypothetical protein